MIFKWWIAVGTRSEWCNFGPPSSLFGTAVGLIVRNF